VALLEKRRFLYNHSGDFPQVILIIPSHVPNNIYVLAFLVSTLLDFFQCTHSWPAFQTIFLTTVVYRKSEFKLPAEGYWKYFHNFIEASRLHF
jgi:hypothetical protein